MKRRRCYKSDIYNFAKLFSNNPVNFDISLRALAKSKCDKDCNGQSMMKSSAKSSRSCRRRALSWLKKNAMQMQMAKWKRMRADRAQDVKVRIPCTLWYEYCSNCERTVVRKSKETLKHVPHIGYT